MNGPGLFTRPASPAPLKRRAEGASPLKRAGASPAHPVLSHESLVPNPLPRKLQNAAVSGFVTMTIGAAA